MLWLPVKYGYWKQKELWDGTYNIGDLMDLLFRLPDFEKDKNILYQLLGNQHG